MKQKIRISGPLIAVLLTALLGGWHFLETRRGAAASGDFWLCDMYIGLFAAVGVILALFGLMFLIPSIPGKVKGTIHWLSAEHAKDTTVMLYDFLFDIENTADIPEDKTYNDYLNPDSLKKLTSCKVEKALANAMPGDKFQFVRMGYFCLDTKNENTFNRVVGLKDSFPKK